MKTKIGVFLSSKSGLPAAYEAAAREVGQLIGNTGRTLVYGGARRGLMEILAQSTRRTGGRIYGMVPDRLVERGWVSDTLDVTFRCADLHDRKAMMLRESDALVVLPGGIGTLDEAFTALAAASFGMERRPLIFYNVGGCWDSLLRALDDLFAAGLVDGRPSDHYAVASGIAELQALLDA